MWFSLFVSWYYIQPVPISRGHSVKNGAILHKYWFDRAPAEKDNGSCIDSIDELEGHVCNEFQVR